MIIHVRNTGGRLMEQKALGAGSHFLDIGYERTCQCPQKHINCMTAKEWLKAQIGVWQFFYEGRDIRDKNLHPATYPIALAKKCIELFTHQGELVIDPFVGSGTTLVAARDINRNAVGFDLNQDYIDLSNKRLAGLVLLPVRIKVIRSEMLLGFFLAAPPRADEIFFSWISFMNKDSIPFVMKHTPLLKVLVCDCFCV
jgi:hypothetical protein